MLTDEQRDGRGDKQPQVGQDKRRVRLDQAATADTGGVGEVHTGLHGSASR